MGTKDEVDAIVRLLAEASASIGDLPRSGSTVSFVALIDVAAGQVKAALILLEDARSEAL